MKIKPEDISVSYYAEGGEVLLGVSVRTSSGYSLYKPTNTDCTDWERLASSKNPIDFDKIIFGKKTTTEKPKNRPSAKNNKEEKPAEKTPSKTTTKGKEAKSTAEPKRVKKSFL